MLTIERIQNSVVEVLKAALPTIHIEAFPANFKQFLKSFRHVNGAILVQYVRKKNTHIAPRNGTRVVQIEIVVIKKNLRKHTGVFPLLDAAEAVISGVPLMETYQTGNPENPTARRKIGVTLHHIEEEYQDYLEELGLWMYAQQYLSDPFAFTFAEDEAAVLISELSLQVGEKIEITVPESQED